MLGVLSQIITAAALLAGSITDIRAREVPDWLNYAAAVAGIGMAAIYSAVTLSWWPLIYSAAGLIIFLAIAFIMFYTGQWGGGDSKLLIALGALMGFEFSINPFFVGISQPLISFWVNLLVSGVVYAFAWSVFLAARNLSGFAMHFSQQAAELKRFRLTIISAAAISLAFFLIAKDAGSRTAVIGAAAAIAAGGFLLVFTKAVEKSSMLKLVDPEKLTEGDWIAKNVYSGKKYICGPKDLGIEKRQIRELLKLKRQGKITKILIKEGIPFVPSFLIAFILTLKVGNVLILFLA